MSFPFRTVLIFFNILFHPIWGEGGSYVLKLQAVTAPQARTAVITSSVESFKVFFNQ